MSLASIPRPASALVAGASGGIGAAFAAKLAGTGLTVHRTARGPGAHHHLLDITDEAAIASFCANLRDQAPPLRLVIVATGVLHDATLQPEKSMRALDAGTLARSFAVNAIGPAILAKHVVPLLPRSGRCIIAFLSARVGSIADNELGGWYGYRASKAALNQFVRTLAIETRRTHPETILVSLHPGTVETALSAPFRGQVEPTRLFMPDVAAGHLGDVINALRPEDSGGFAWNGAPIPF